MSPAEIPAELPAGCAREITANVVALDQPIVYNRLGAVNPIGMIYALRRDVVNKSTGLTEAEGGVLSEGQVKLRDDKRPRPLTLRMNAGDCLVINFQNLLNPTPLSASAPLHGEQPATRDAAIHGMGMQPVESILDDGSNVGENTSSLVPPGGTATYKLYADKEGSHLLYDPADTSSGEALSGTLAFGLFGAVNVEPAGSEWYRSQVTRIEMQDASTGTTAAGQPIINYDATYPTWRGYTNTPILAMLDANNEVVHSDLNAIITGPNQGPFSASAYPANPTYPNRLEPFREFTTIFHDEVAINQAFPIFDDPEFEFTLHGVRDSFALNYGAAGAGAEIIANRLGVGPMWDCVECGYEEFFLSSWVVGDPAMVVDIPANTIDSGGNLITGPKATKALYPDDPSNVAHGYLNDRTIIRNLHAGTEHHIFHLHAQQWLLTPDDDNSNYLDSQAIGMGDSYTYEIAFGGAGNRNKTIGDSIFHCHFYPHFAQGMWGLWRVHDVFEDGTELDGAGKPAAGSRALPDGEIAVGTPIPALVPLPDQPMAPMPGAEVEIVNGQADIQPLPSNSTLGNPGYPFFVAGRAGHRAPTAPLDLSGDGGLERHVITGGTANSSLTPLDFGKSLATATAQFIPETGTAAEQAAMAFHEQRFWDSYLPDGTAATGSSGFETNGLPRRSGAPFAEPCRQDNGTLAPSAASPRIIKAADIQLDMVLNKAGWHFPQSRIVALWGDALATLNGSKAPEPLVMRANSGDCIVYLQTNLIPAEYQQDAFQVRTPTDVVGRHIHLVKFDVTASDGSANGFNYEDGTLSPDAVRERINAIRLQNGCASPDPLDGTNTCPVAEPHSVFGAGPGGKWLGARTTVQRWYADPVVNKYGVDRTLGNVFTHDHLSPSTHQQAGLYAALLIEPTGSTWRNPETGEQFGNRVLPVGGRDGGPTSWRADILTANPSDSFREFLLEFQDFQLAYDAGRGVDANGNIIPDPLGAINPPGMKEVGLPDIYAKPENCPNGASFVPNGCPEAIAADDVGTYSVNYRNEPLGLRVRDPKTNTQSPGSAGDLSWAFSSLVPRADTRLNQQPNFYPPLTAGVRPGDPFTPLMRVYENDRVKIKTLVGANEEGHNLTVHGVKWLREEASPNSGWRNGQMAGISEQFTFEMPVLPGTLAGGNVDYLWEVSASSDGLWNGNWGLMRTYKGSRNDLLALPNNAIGKSGVTIANQKDFSGIIPKNAKVRAYDVTAVLAKDALPGGTLVYNSREGLDDPTAILYVLTKDLDKKGKLKAGVPIEPLILRAAAGESIQVTLRNRLPSVAPDLPGFNAMPPIIDGFNANDVIPSSHVGLHPQLVAYDVFQSDGTRVGLNSSGTAGPGETKTYRWYAGDVKYNPSTKRLVATPAEFGATNLMSSDRIKHSSKGAIGALIIEPVGSTWVEDAGTRASATVTKKDGSKFRDFVLLFQTDLNLRWEGQPLPFVGGVEDAEDSGNDAINYRTEPLWARLGIDPGEEHVDGDFANALSNSQVGGDPETPVFTAKAGTAIRLRILNPGGHTRNSVFVLHGHTWQREPYVSSSTAIGTNPYSQWTGSQTGHGPANHFDVVPQHGAGGKFAVPGDYLYRDFAPFQFYQGIWGILRVEE